jgi:hypothetical protein
VTAFIAYRRKCIGIDDPSLGGDDLPEDHFSHLLALLENEGQLDGADDTDTALAMLSQRYSYVFPSTSVLEMLSDLGPIVEMGAGTGYWAYKLRSMGVDIIAFDLAPPDGGLVNRYHAKTETWTHVEQGNHTVLGAYSGRALFLCWPPLFSALGECLSYYRGDTVAYIGDDGHRTARLDQLPASYKRMAEASVHALEPYPGVPASLTIWKRAR